MRYGRFREFYPAGRWFYIYERAWKGERLLVVERLIRTADGQRVGFSREFLTPAFGPLYAVSGHAPEADPEPGEMG